MFSPEPMQWLGLLGSCRVGCISREGSGSLSEKSGRDKVEPTLLAALLVKVVNWVKKGTKNVKSTPLFLIQ